MATDLRQGSVIEVFDNQARTADPTPVEFLVIDGDVRGIAVFVNVTALAATPSVVPTLEVKARTGTWITLKAFTAITNITGTGLYGYFIYPGITDLDLADLVADEVVAYPIPTEFRWSMVHGDTDSITYDVTLQCLR